MFKMAMKVVKYVVSPVVEAVVLDYEINYTTKYKHLKATHANEGMLIEKALEKGKRIEKEGRAITYRGYVRRAVTQRSAV